MVRKGSFQAEGELFSFRGLIMGKLSCRIEDECRDKELHNSLLSEGFEGGW